MAKSLIDELLEANSVICEAIVAYYNLDLAGCERKVRIVRDLISLAEELIDDAWGDKPEGPGHHG